jgi:CelD/BcsL family acetyltransferase involved in cellulose biosynthesis
LRRALRLAKQRGPLVLQPAASLAEALGFLDSMKKLDRWAAAGGGGAFASGAREAFHRHLIRRGWAQGAVEMLRACAGENVLGYLYQFRHRGRVMAYQAAYPPAADNRHRPGLVMHYLAIERARAAGFQVYDLLAGDARYKRSLGQQENMLVWRRLQKPGLLSGAENFLRQAAAPFRRGGSMPLGL